MSITYQQAKRIRKTGLMNLFADQLMYEQKVSTAIKKTISLKTRAKVKGITQYFDPLNIAKMLTFGSALGPALLGHFMKRDPKDIQYFTGRLKPIRERDTASKISKVPGGEGGFSAEANTTLHKIYSLLSISHEENNKRRELAKNREEEHMLEDERRHKELIEALGGKTTATPVRATEAPQQEDKSGGLFQMLFDMIKTLGLAIYTFVGDRIGEITGKISVLSENLKRLTKYAEKIGKFVTKSLFASITSAINILSFVFNFLRNPYVAVALAGGLIAWGIYNALKIPLKEREVLTFEKTLAKKEGQLEEAKKKYGINSSEVQEIQKDINQLQTLKEKSQSELDIMKQTQKAEESKSIIDKMLDKGSELFGLEDLKKDAATLDSEIDFSKFKKEEPTATQIMPQDDIGQFEMQKENAPPVDEAERSSALEGVLKQNLEQKVALASKKNNPEPTINNTTTVQQANQQVANKRGVPSVRNQDSTYQEIVYNNTVVLT